MKKLNNSYEENKMLNHREVLEALLAGETLVDVNDKEITLRFDGDSIVGEYSTRLASIALVDWEIKPKTININGYEVPEPLSNLVITERYYLPYLPDGNIYEFTFDNSIINSNRWVTLGLVHKTREAAELHLEALLSFTKHE
jgi:hypothetical protein